MPRPKPSDKEYYKLCNNIHEIEDNLKKLKIARDSYLQFLGEQSLKKED